MGSSGCKATSPTLALAPRTPRPPLSGAAQPTNSLRDYERISGEPTRLGCSTLVDHRGYLKKMAKGKLPRGATHAFVANRADAYEFDLAACDNPDLMILHEVARTYAGEYLAIWTYGHAVHVWHALSPAPGAEATVTVAHLRLVAPGGRSGQAFEALRQAMDRGALKPDFDAASALLGRDSIPVGGWFAAFGIEGAAELVATDRKGAWARFERVPNCAMSVK